MKKTIKFLCVALLLSGIGLVAYYFLMPGQALSIFTFPAQQFSISVSPPPVAAAKPAPPSGLDSPVDQKPQDAQPQSLQEPRPKYPIDTGNTTQPEPKDALEVAHTLWPSKLLEKILVNENLEKNLVITVDNLGRSFASPQLWPLKPAPGKFLIRADAQEKRIDAKNYSRYAAYVQLLDKVDLKIAVPLYKALYPRLQKEYVDLGYPKAYFNDRVVEVIDLLLKTPEMGSSPRLVLPPIDSPFKEDHPWLRYEYQDEELESLMSGQKMLIRMGASNSERVKAKLAALRALITDKPTPTQN